MSDLNEVARKILQSSCLKDKLANYSITRDSGYLGDVAQKPERCIKTTMSSKQIKFPRGHFHLNEKKAIALHSFANHELLAIEIMAYILLKLPADNLAQKKIRKAIYHSLQDEQKHCQMYINRLNQLGYEFGDFPLNDFLWKFTADMKSYAHYFSIMSLTFEAANLDFAKHFISEFEAVQDKETSGILQEVYLDEISHVALGGHYLNHWSQDKSLWNYYQSLLPYPLTPARSKGQKFDEQGRRKARLPGEFIQKVRDYTDEFNITARKEWKTPIT